MDARVNKVINNNKIFLLTELMPVLPIIHVSDININLIKVALCEFFLKIGLALFHSFSTLSSFSPNPLFSDPSSLQKSCLPETNQLA